MRVRILSRASTLAVVQAALVTQALSERWPAVTFERLTRTSQGDRDSQVRLAEAVDKGLFTADLSEALVTGEAELVVHSWKDLPIDQRADTLVAGTLARADVRDVLLVRQSAVVDRPRSLAVLTSSPRRAWQLQSSLAPLLPWPVTAIEPRDIRGNIPTRLRKLADGDAHALVVAKAALDRLLTSEGAGEIRRVLDACTWMILPVREFPAAPAQGALAIEVAAGRPDIIEMVRAISHEPTARACHAERALLRAYGGGCREAIGATTIVRDYGTITSVRGRVPNGDTLAVWSLDRTGTTPPRTIGAHIWPRPDERASVERRPLGHGVGATPMPSSDARGWWISRAEALPSDLDVPRDRIVWVAGPRTWEKLAARGVWVHGSSEGLGDHEPPAVDALAGEPVAWHRLTHVGGVNASENATATYEVDQALPDDLMARTHFFWTSGSAFLAAIERFPEIRAGWHASGPGRTARVIRAALDAPDRVSIWLDYDQWRQSILF